MGLEVLSVNFSLESLSCKNKRIPQDFEVTGNDFVLQVLVSVDSLWIWDSIIVLILLWLGNFRVEH